MWPDSEHTGTDRQTLTFKEFASLTENGKENTTDGNTVLIFRDLGGFFCLVEVNN